MVVSISCMCEVSSTMKQEHLVACGINGRKIIGCIRSQPKIYPNFLINPHLNFENPTHFLKKLHTHIFLFSSRLTNPIFSMFETRNKLFPKPALMYMLRYHTFLYRKIKSIYKFNSRN